MLVGGADFSGARDPRIYYALGDLNGRRLDVQALVPCDDRLDLFAAIQQTKIAWGLDFPFALPAAAYPALGLSTWRDLLEKAVSLTREAFVAWLRQPFEGRCSDANVYCRHTDAVLGAYSPFKRFNPGMRSMFYSGLKLLAYGVRQGWDIYPFTLTGRIYEVYPSHTWAKAGLRRTTDLAAFVDQFNRLGLIEVVLPPELHTAPTQDATDSVVACITTAAVVAKIDDMHRTVTSQEWDARHLEGLIVRI